MENTYVCSKKKKLQKSERLCFDSLLISIYILHKEQIHKDAAILCQHVAQNVNLLWVLWFSPRDIAAVIRCEIKCDTGKQGLTSEFSFPR